MPNYQNGKIYCLRSHKTDKIYIGSTTQKLSQRMAKHRNHYKSNVYVSSCELLCYDDCYIELIELYPCNNKMELRKREGEIIRDRECINKRIAGRNKKDWYNDNKERLLNKQKEWRKKNKKHTKKYYKEYYQKNKILKQTNT